MTGAGRVLAAAAIMLLAGCAGTSQEWAKPGAARAARLAVLPFDNQTPALRAGSVASDLVVSELLATGAVPVMEPGEVVDLLRRENIDVTDAARLPSAQRIGRLLGASHVLQGSVTEYRYKPGLSEIPVVGITARVVEVASGEVVWTATHSRVGWSWFVEDGLARLAQSVARDMAAHLSGALGQARAR